MLSPFTPVTIDRTRTEFPGIGAAWRAHALRIDDRLGLHALAAIADDPQPAAHGPLAGVPVLVKDTIDTADLSTTAGSLVLPEEPPATDAWIVDALRAAGATIAAKTTCSEWANFRGEGSISGWNARYGLARNPYDPTRSAGGSSSGSAIAVAAGMSPIAIGTETDGSMLCPASLNGVIGFKTAPKRLDRSGVIPISSTQDSLGIFATSADDLLVVASVLGIEATTLTEPVRLCVVEESLNGFHPRTLARFHDVLELLSRAGVDVVTLSAPPRGTLEPSDEDELIVLRTELHVELDRYLDRRAIPGLRSLADVVAANDALADRELAYFGQEHFVAALEADPADPAYRAARQRNLERTTEGIESSLAATDALAILAPTMDVAWPIDLLRGDPNSPAGYRAAAVAGGTSVSVPAGRIGHLPVGVCLSAPAGHEETILELTALLERALAPLAGLAGRERPTTLLPEA
ncbi:amidase family protein [Acidimicrobium ferrooxidans]|uniref:amidase family protein n=1 Tax=Acidimicrobium ferrooxidans TaxID=53635 RepID=UPI00019DE4F4|nr:amidase family protein [Acidimicrobium ferrooxidans]